MGVSGVFAFLEAQTLSAFRAGATQCGNTVVRASLPCPGQLLRASGFVVCLQHSPGAGFKCPSTSDCCCLLLSSEDVSPSGSVPPAAGLILPCCPPGPILDVPGAVWSCFTLRAASCKRPRCAALSSPSPGRGGQRHPPGDAPAASSCWVPNEACPFAFRDGLCCFPALLRL